MLYTVTISQTCLERFNKTYGSEFDYRHAVIIDFFRSFFSSGSKEILSKIVTIEGERYFWVAHITIVHDLPFFDLNDPKTVKRIIDDLVKYEVIKKRKQRAGTSNRMYFAPGDRFDIMTRSGIPQDVKDRLERLRKD